MSDERMTLDLDLAPLRAQAVTALEQVVRQAFAADGFGRPGWGAAIIRTEAERLVRAAVADGRVARAVEAAIAEALPDVVREVLADETRKAVRKALRDVDLRPAVQAALELEAARE